MKLMVNKIREYSRIFIYLFGYIFTFDNLFCLQILKFVNYYNKEKILNMIKILKIIYTPCS